MNTLIRFHLHQERIHSLESQITACRPTAAALRVKANPIGESTTMNPGFDPRDFHAAFFHLHLAVLATLRDHGI
jgi:hypothetical protein